MNWRNHFAIGLLVYTFSSNACDKSILSDPASEETRDLRAGGYLCAINPMTRYPRLHEQ